MSVLPLCSHSNQGSAYHAALSSSSTSSTKCKAFELKNHLLQMWHLHYPIESWAHSWCLRNICCCKKKKKNEMVKSGHKLTIVKEQSFYLPPLHPEVFLRSPQHSYEFPPPGQGARPHPHSQRCFRWRTLYTAWQFFPIPPGQREEFAAQSFHSSPGSQSRSLRFPHPPCLQLTPLVPQPPATGLGCPPIRPLTQPSQGHSDN